ncbi:MAG: hypothetical protein IJ622_01130 [Bacteroidales bacterium]|nr:hypothetical protein [Bacteroidales bacterium]
MKKTLSIFTLLLFAFASCHKPETPADGGTPLPSHNDPVYHVGDYYHNDTLEGVVFFSYDGRNGLMVSLEEACLSWCEPNYVNSETGATNPYDGWHNTNILMSNYDLRHYPAIQWSHLRNTWHLAHQNYSITAYQWFVPSNDELRYLLQNQSEVNRALESLGYPTLEDKAYWSSTELGTRSAAALRVQDDSIIVSETLKNETLYVRAIRNF